MLEGCLHLVHTPCIGRACSAGYYFACVLPAGVQLYSTCLVSDQAVKDRLQQVSQPALQATLIYAPGLQKVPGGTTQQDCSARGLRGI